MYSLCSNPMREFGQLTLSLLNCIFYTQIDARQTSLVDPNSCRAVTIIFEAKFKFVDDLYFDVPLISLLFYIEGNVSWLKAVAKPALRKDSRIVSNIWLNKNDIFFQKSAFHTLSRWRFRRHLTISKTPSLDQDLFRPAKWIRQKTPHFLHSLHWQKNHNKLGLAQVRTLMEVQIFNRRLGFNNTWRESKKNSVTEKRILNLYIRLLWNIDAKTTNEVLKKEQKYSLKKFYCAKI